ncbi:hypothetical protein EUTSA_v10011095mg [Eutrema salsugineum]|uniref:SUEL-type lectin domain-containing protein n=1 Tax=Eutrema salsugineum TaxID=72664 RepID=V4LN57_EUTSA|nr:hypothetical protein EUTSA_v10011095mg [Eutrema salsugineum]
MSYSRGFIILRLVMFISFLSGFVLKINGSYDHARDIKIHSDRKRILAGSKSEEWPPTGKEYVLCGIHKLPENGPFSSPMCDKGYVISEIKFADYGQPTGSCETFKRGKCGAPATLQIVKKNCIGKEECWLPVTDDMFGPTHCKGPISFAFLGTCKKKKI